MPAVTHLAPGDFLRRSPTEQPIPTLARDTLFHGPLLLGIPLSLRISERASLHSLPGISVAGVAHGPEVGGVWGDSGTKCLDLPPSPEPVRS